MKVLVCEHLTEEGHVNLFINVCKFLSNKGYDVVAVIPSNFSKSMSFCEVKRMNFKYYSDEYPQSSGLHKVIYSLRVQSFINKLYRRDNYIATFVITYDEISLAIGKCFGYIKEPFFIIQNSNPDAISFSKYRRIAFDLIKDKVYSVTLGGFVKDFLVSSFHVDPSRVLVLPHPMYVTDKNSILDIDCVGISNSNDETIIERIIENEKKYGLIKQNNLKVLLKSKKHIFDNGNLTIITGFIDSSIYDDYISRAKCIFLPFSSSFQYRISGTLIDALSNNKCIIGTDIPVISQSSKCYPGVIRLYNESTFISDIVEIGKDSSFKSDSFIRFQEQHGEIILSNILSRAIENAIAKKPMEVSYDF